jgi:hypothetical protein
MQRETTNELSRKTGQKQKHRNMTAETKKLTGND